MVLCYIALWFDEIGRLFRDDSVPIVWDCYQTESDNLHVNIV